MGCLLNPLEGTHSLPHDLTSCSTELNTSTVLPAGNPENKVPALMGQQVRRWARLSLTFFFSSIDCLVCECEDQPIRTWIRILYQHYSGVTAPSSLSPQGGRKTQPVDEETEGHRKPLKRMRDS